LSSRGFGSIWFGCAWPRLCKGACVRKQMRRAQIPKTEIRNPKEIRTQKSEPAELCTPHEVEVPLPRGTSGERARREGFVAIARVQSFSTFLLSPALSSFAEEREKTCWDSSAQGLIQRQCTLALSPQQGPQRGECRGGVRTIPWVRNVAVVLGTRISDLSISPPRTRILSDIPFPGSWG
jgi:hypothetical protein